MRSTISGWRRAGSASSGHGSAWGRAARTGGRPIAWGLVRSLSRSPVLYTEGGGTWQGCTVSVATLTELRPAGPVDVADIPVHFDDVGMAGARRGRTVDGAIVRAVPDRSFTVRYTGSMRFSETYVRAAGRYRLAARTSRMPGC